MQFDFKATAGFMRRQFVRLAWTTTQQKWTTTGVAAALVITTAFIPNLGIAIFGTAFAGWWLVLGVMTLLGGLLGSRIGVGREKSRLLRAVEQLHRDGE